MSAFASQLPWLIAMGVLIGMSAFFSGSEAAMFSLSGRDRRSLKSASTAHQLAFRLLSDPDRLLSAVLLWNLVINVAYFAIASIVGIALGKDERAGQGVAVAFALVALLTLIFLSEMLPKSVAVIVSRPVAALVSVPLAICVRITDPMLPLLRNVTLLSRRLIWPHFQVEPHFRVDDLERAIEISTTDAALREHERHVLTKIVGLTDIRADEWMRPRMQFLIFRPPVSLKDLAGRVPPSGYLLVTEPDSEEVAGAVPIRSLWDIPETHLEFRAEPVLYVPWCMPVARVLHLMRRKDREVAVVVNEHGETIGVLTVEDILDSAFSHHEGQPTQRSREAIREVDRGTWHVAGIMSLRRLAKRFSVELPSCRSVTVAGLVQELLQRLPEPGDRCEFGPLLFEVLQAPQRGQMLLQMTRHPVEDAP